MRADCMAEKKTHLGFRVYTCNKVPSCCALQLKHLILRMTGTCLLAHELGKNIAASQVNGAGDAAEAAGMLSKHMNKRKAVPLNSEGEPMPQANTLLVCSYQAMLTCRRGHAPINELRHVILFCAHVHRVILPSAHPKHRNAFKMMLVVLPAVSCHLRLVSFWECLSLQQLQQTRKIAQLSAVPLCPFGYFCLHRLIRFSTVISAVTKHEICRQ